MNFDPEASPWNMPELRWHWGYPFSLVMMLGVAAGELFFFWRRGWFTSTKEQSEDDSAGEEYGEANEPGDRNSR